MPFAVGVIVYLRMLQRQFPHPDTSAEELPGIQRKRQPVCDEEGILNGAAALRKQRPPDSKPVKGREELVGIGDRERIRFSPYVGKGL